MAIPFDKIEPLALIRHLRAERPALHQIEELHKDLTYRVAREAMMASGLTEAEEVQGRAEKNLIKPSRANPLKIVNLVDATEGLPLKFVRASYIEGGEHLSSSVPIVPASSPLTGLLAWAAVGLDEQEDVDRVDPPANTTIYVVADLDSRDGRKLVQEALKLIVSCLSARLACPC